MCFVVSEMLVLFPFRVEFTREGTTKEAGETNKYADMNQGHLYKTTTQSNMPVC